MADNKIKYGLKNVYYAKLTYGTNGEEIYGTPVRIPGAVNLEADASGDMNNFYADDTVYWKSSANNGYEGTLEVALLPDSFRTDILGETADSDGVMWEYANVEPAEFALLFEFQGDQNAVRHSFLRCSASRAAVNGATKEDSITPQTETLNISAMPRISDQLVKGKCDATASPTQYAAWFTSVIEP
jgi:phi13 family phage major tail protein